MTLAFVICGVLAVLIVVQLVVFELRLHKRRRELRRPGYITDFMRDRRLP